MAETATFDGYSTGLLWRPPDPRNYDMSKIESVQQMLAVGFPDSDEHLKEHCSHIYDQGPTPSCTTHFTAGMMTCNEHIERHGETLVFDAMGLFNETGAPNVGRYTGDILKITQDRGILRVGTSKRYRIGSYAFAPTTSVDMWVSTIKAAVAAGHMCGLALLLPSSFGWESSGSIVQNSYHQVGIVGYRPDAFLILNSWSANWGRGGFGWVPISFLVQSGYQSGYVFSHTILDAIDDDLAPNPPEPPQPPQPPQPPAPVVVPKVIGYTPTEPLPSVRAGKVFSVLGSGFGTGGNLFVSWGGQPLAVTTRSAGGLVVTAPPTPGIAPVVVRVEASEAVGPMLGVVAGDVTPPNPPNPPDPGPNPPEPPTPPDPGGLVIDPKILRTGLYVWVRDASGASVGATVMATVNGTPLGAFNRHTGADVPATFLIGRNHGTAQITAKTDDGATTVTGTKDV